MCLILHAFVCIMSMCFSRIENPPQAYPMLCGPTRLRRSRTRVVSETHLRSKRDLLLGSRFFFARLPDWDSGNKSEVTRTTDSMRTNEDRRIK
jgi:hypothetical protein